MMTRAMYLHWMGKCIKPNDGGATWSQPTSSDFDPPILACFFLNLSVGYAVGDAGNILETRDGGAIWRKHDSGIRSTLTSVSFVNDSTGYMVGNDGVILKSDRY